MPYLNSNIVPLFLECGKRKGGRKKKTKCRDLAIFLSNEKVRIPVFDIDINKTYLTLLELLLGITIT